MEMDGDNEVEAVNLEIADEERTNKEEKTNEEENLEEAGTGQEPVESAEGTTQNPDTGGQPSH
jgi:hypothetical protein